MLRMLSQSAKGSHKEFLYWKRGNVYIKRFCGYHIEECIVIKVSVETGIGELEAKSVEKVGYSVCGQDKRR